MAKILVTGASGFIGTALCKALETKRHDVYPMTRYVASDSRYNYYDLSRRIICDVRNGDRVAQIIGEVKPDVVIHLAAMSAVSYSFLSLETAREVTEVIYMGTMNVAHACLKHGVSELINSSTSEFYGHQTEFPIKETAVPRPLSPYAVAKLAAEEYLQYLGRTEGLPFTTIRPFNTYGRAQVKKSYFVVERAITQALTDHHIHLYTPTPVRDLLDRDSHVDAYVKCLGNTKAIGQCIGIGTGTGVTIGQMADKVAHIVADWTGKTVMISWDMAPDRPHDIPCLIVDNQKAREILGWKPLYTLDEGLRIHTIEWADVLGVKLNR